jgi:hypothetical protein
MLPCQADESVLPVSKKGDYGSFLISRSAPSTVRQNQPRGYHVYAQLYLSITTLYASLASVHFF